ncbi:tryptophan halogenase family protein [Thalassotalea mangrovi]|uniref:Tryptophan 7-halogenase n=1 Tax=Thalassotalea mangrovi TaxID=2572245 RepID=A0A4U1B6T0_9GAMM|nr:tryptophan halogenase family protein [Thalassotalea mangrovi]TKB46267.1 tryptophan 7-halogenase [Thalassotalea mangrovi]
MSEQNPFHIVILGGGTAGWMAANLFAKRWQNQAQHRPVKITLIESKDVGIIGVGEGSTPTLKRFFEDLQIPESEWMPLCDATYKINIRFKGWSPKSGIEDYSHPFTTQVDTFTKRAFLVNGRTRRMGLDTHTRPDDFLLNGVLASQGKGPITPNNFPFIMEYGYHFDSAKLGEFLKQKAIAAGVNYQTAHISQSKRAATGELEALIDDQGNVFSGDFFIDCSGFSSLLMQKAMQVPYKSFKSNLFNDSAVVMPTPIDRIVPVETEATTLSSGWCWKIPLTSRYGNGYVFSSDFISRDQAETEFRQHLGMLDSEQECRFLSMQVGQLSEHWSHNCLGLGLSQGFIEPLEATALHLVQISIELFANLLEKGNFSHHYAHEYNQKISERFERVRDYIVAHYKLNTRDDSEYWRANRNNDQLSQSLISILDCWYQRNDLSEEIQRQNLDTHFDAISWNCLLAGYGTFPPLAPNQPGKGDLYKEKGIASFLQGCSLNFNDHHNNLRALNKS